MKQYHVNQVTRLHQTAVFLHRFVIGRSAFIIIFQFLPGFISSWSTVQNRPNGGSNSFYCQHKYLCDKNSI